MEHNRRCENSTTDARRCRCSCNGELHGGTHYSFGIADDRSGAVDGPVASTSKGQPQAHTSPRDMTDTAQRAVAEIIDWLAENPTVGEQASAIAELVTDQAVAAMERYGHATSRQDLTLNHFLCGLLAALAHAIDQFKQSLNRVPDLVISMIIGRSDQLGLNAVAVKVAVRTIWRLIMQLPVFSQVDSLLCSVRIAAVLICPALDKHQDVLRDCLYPLGGGIISAATEHRLKELLYPGHE